MTAAPYRRRTRAALRVKRGRPAFIWNVREYVRDVNTGAKFDNMTLCVFTRIW